MRLIKELIREIGLIRKTGRHIAKEKIIEDKLDSPIPINNNDSHITDREIEPKPITRPPMKRGRPHPPPKNHPWKKKTYLHTDIYQQSEQELISSILKES